MKGMVNNYVKEKGFGFIDGEDGQSYFLHVSEIQDRADDSLPRSGVPVEFDPSPSPKGLRAKKVLLLSESDIDTYQKPDSFLTFKDEIKGGWKVLESTHWVVTSEHKDLESAKRNAIQKAQSLGANAMTDFKYSKRTGSRGTYGRGRYGGGVYRFTIHCFTGRPAIVGRPSASGVSKEDFVCNLEENSKKAHAEQISEGYVAAGIKMFAALVAIGMMMLAAQSMGMFGFVIGVMCLIIALNLSGGYKPKIKWSPEKHD